jgi:hypothetical protein
MDEEQEGEDLHELIDVPKDFSVITWAGTIPMCDDLWLRMQAQHIAAVDIGIVRPLELHTARKIFNEEGYLDVMMALNGVGQMWLFALYEFLRTWRQRAKLVLKLAEQYSATKLAKQQAFIEKAVADAKVKQKHIHTASVYYARHISLIADQEFVGSVRDYFEKTDGWFSVIEELRMNLAKHEVPKSKGLVAEAPGYARMDQVTGTLYWQFIASNGGLEKIDRRDAANFFLGIKVPGYDE